jgi:Inovirus Coat protein B
MKKCNLARKPEAEQFVAANDDTFGSYAKGAAVTVVALGTSAANAAAMTLPTEISDALLSVGVIGAGVFAIAVGIKLYKWIRRAL